MVKSNLVWAGVTLASLLLTTWVGLSNIEYASRNKVLNKEKDDLESDRDLYKAASVYWKEKCKQLPKRERGANQRDHDRAAEKRD